MRVGMTTFESASCLSGRWEGFLKLSLRWCRAWFSPTGGSSSRRGIQSQGPLPLRTLWRSRAPPHGAGLAPGTRPDWLSVDWSPDSCWSPVVATLLVVAWVLEKMGGAGQVLKGLWGCGGGGAEPWLLLPVGWGSHG